MRDEEAALRRDTEGRVPVALVELVERLGREALAGSVDEQVEPAELIDRPRDQCLCLHTQRAARVLARRFDEALRAFNLTNGQFSLLMSLNRASPPGIGESAAFLAMDRTTLARNLEPLQRDGLVEVKPGKDQRMRLVRLTTKGADLLAQAIPIWEEGQQSIIDHLGVARWTALMGDLSSLVAMAKPEA